MSQYNMVPESGFKIRIDLIEGVKETAELLTAPVSLVSTKHMTPSVIKGTRKQCKCIQKKGESLVNIQPTFDITFT